MIELPHQDKIEDVVFRTAEEQFGAIVRKNGRIASAIKDLSDYYIADPAQRGHCPDTPTHRAARMLFFTLADMPKAYLAAMECDRLTGNHHDAAVRILDIGAGYGAQSLGLLAYLSTLDTNRPVHLDLVDRDRHALGSFSAVLANFRGTDLFNNVSHTILRLDLEKTLHLKESYDYIIVGNTLCELRTATHQSLILNLLSSLSAVGTAFLIEPALKKTTRNLHALRDSLLENDQCRVIAPCTRTGTCPCLIKSNDWCHESRPALLPVRCRQLATATGLRRSRLKWSYLTLVRPDNPRETTWGDTWRTVSEPMKEKGRHEVFLCGDPGRYRAVLPNKEKTPDNESLQTLDRGHLVQIRSAEIVNDRMKVSRSSTVIPDDPIQR